MVKSIANTYLHTHTDIRTRTPASALRAYILAYGGLELSVAVEKVGEVGISTAALSVNEAWKVWMMISWGSLWCSPV